LGQAPLAGDEEKAVLRGLRQGIEQRDSRAVADHIVSWVRMALVASMIIVVVLGGESLRPYPGAIWWWSAGAIAYTLLAFFMTTRHSHLGLWKPWTAWTLSIVSGAFVVGLCAVTGAGRSPILPVAITVVISTAIRFDLARSLLAAGTMGVALAAVILWVPQPPVPWEERIRDAIWWTWLLVAVALLVGVLSQAADVARRARARAEAEAETEHRRLEEERRLRHRLETIDEARKDFLHALSHDFRTPIASIEALAAALARRRGDLAPEEQAELTDLIERHARNLSTMLQEVREVAITESLDGGRRVEVADIFVPELITTAATAAGLPPEQLAMAVDPGLTVLRTDARKLVRILANLLENAYKHSPADQPVEVRLARRDGTVELSVLDRGPGIPPELTSQAFEKFVGFGPHRASGLGMWIVAQFIEALDGTVHAETRPGGGLIVRARFPQAGILPAPPSRLDQTAGRGAGTPAGVAKPPDTWPGGATLGPPSR
jgi:signal transduction histidine kinase